MTDTQKKSLLEELQREFEQFLEQSPEGQLIMRQFSEEGLGVYFEAMTETEAEAIANGSATQIDTQANIDWQDIVLLHRMGVTMDE